MTDPRHARILARIARQVVEQYTTTRSGSTPDADKGNVPVPDRVAPSHPWDAFNVERARQNAERMDSGWNYTLPEEYRG